MGTCWLCCGSLGYGDAVVKQDVARFTWDPERSEADSPVDLCALLHELSGSSAFLLGSASLLGSGPLVRTVSITAARRMCGRWVRHWVSSFVSSGPWVLADVVYGPAGGACGLALARNRSPHGPFVEAGGGVEALGAHRFRNAVEGRGCGCARLRGGMSSRPLAVVTWASARAGSSADAVLNRTCRSRAVPCPRLRRRR